jgi:predicted RNase H-like HicB family nuclease
LKDGSERLYSIEDDKLTMFAEYIQAAMERATYEIIDDPEPFYGEVPELQGVWATGKTLEECRKELQSVIEGWIALKLRLGHPIPPIWRPNHHCFCGAGSNCRIS